MFGTGNPVGSRTPWGLLLMPVFLGWGQGSDGHNVAISHPQGRGLQDAMTKALRDAQIGPNDIDYVNAHYPSTSIGDASEMKALKSVFPAPQQVKFQAPRP